MIKIPKFKTMNIDHLIIINYDHFSRWNTIYEKCAHLKKDKYSTTTKKKTKKCDLLGQL